MSVLTVCHPAVLAVFTLPPLQLPGFEAVAVAVHQSAADCLDKHINTLTEVDIASQVWRRLRNTVLCPFFLFVRIPCPVIIIIIII